ncbi:hypothetical protein Tco_0885269 [Tanacetum coccineum]
MRGGGEMVKETPGGMRKAAILSVRKGLEKLWDKKEAVRIDEEAVKEYCDTHNSNVNFVAICVVAALGLLKAATNRILARPWLTSRCDTIKAEDYNSNVNFVAICVVAALGLLKAATNRILGGCDESRCDRLKLRLSASWLSKFLDLQPWWMYPLSSIVYLSEPDFCLHIQAVSYFHLGAFAIAYVFRIIGIWRLWHGNLIRLWLQPRPAFDGAGNGNGDVKVTDKRGTVLMCDMAKINGLIIPKVNFLSNLYIASV